MICVLLMIVPNFAIATGISSYRLGTGDVIIIQVYDEADLSLEQRLPDTGLISYPFLGELKVSGLTVLDLEKKITDGLKDGYLVDPKVTVTVKEYRPFYIHGQVKKPGSYPYQPSLTVRKAVSLAGGFGDRASLNKIFVIRSSDVTHSQRRVNLNSPIFPGDIITIQESFF